jgi:predicted phage replisome organizer
MKRIDWLKLYTGFFEDEKIILLLSMKHGSEIIIFFLRLLTISAKQNQNGMISFSNNVPYSLKNLASICQISSRKCEDFLNILEQFQIIFIEFPQNSDYHATDREVKVEVEADKEKDKKEITSSKILNDSLDGKNENSEKSSITKKESEFEKYLCPTTLFRASKFDEYLNQTSNCQINQTPAGISNFKDRE